MLGKFVIVIYPLCFKKQKPKLLLFLSLKEELPRSQPHPQGNLKKQP